MDKKALRSMIREKKRAMTEDQIISASKRLGELFCAHPLYKSAKLSTATSPIIRRYVLSPSLSKR